MEEFLATLNNESVKLNNVDLKLISHFDHFLKTKKKISTNTAAKYLTLLKGVFLKALRQETINKNPFANFTFKTTEVTKEFLTQDELAKMEAKKIENASVNNVRLVFDSVMRMI